MLSINMEIRLLLSVVLFLVNINGYTGTPTSRKAYEASRTSSTGRSSMTNAFGVVKNITNINMESSDKNISIDDLERETGDAATQATFVRSSSVNPYHQLYIASTKRRTEAEDVNTASASESFYPQFLRNSRHYFPNSEADRFRPTSGRAKFTAEQSLLGSGDFGVLKGGTFYQDTDQHPVRTFSELYGVGNGHQRPFASPLVQKFRYPSADSSDPFSNFRDFADINVSNDAGQYSELYVVYANKNNTSPVLTENQKPIAKKNNRIRNIKDQLDLIDDEQKLSKLSKTKLKLRKSKKQKITQNTSTTEIPSTAKISDADSDYMLALS